MHHYCNVHDIDMTSTCCGCPEMSMVPGMCGRCHEWTGFDCGDCLDELEEESKCE